MLDYFFLYAHAWERDADAAKGWWPGLAGQGSCKESQSSSSCCAGSISASSRPSEWSSFIWARNPSHLENGLNGKCKRWKRHTANWCFEFGSSYTAETDTDKLASWHSVFIGFPSKARFTWSSTWGWIPRGDQSTLSISLHLFPAIQFPTFSNPELMLCIGLALVARNLLSSRCKAVVVSSAFSVLVSTAGSAWIPVRTHISFVINSQLFHKPSRFQGLALLRGLPGADMIWPLNQTCGLAVVILL